MTTMIYSCFKIYEKENYYNKMPYILAEMLHRVLPWLELVLKHI